MTTDSRDPFPYRLRQDLETRHRRGRALPSTSDRLSAVALK